MYLHKLIIALDNVFLIENINFFSNNTLPLFFLFHSVNKFIYFCHEQSLIKCDRWTFVLLIYFVFRVNLILKDLSLIYSRIYWGGGIRVIYKAKKKLIRLKYVLAKMSLGQSVIGLFKVSM